MYNNQGGYNNNNNQGGYGGGYNQGGFGNNNNRQYNSNGFGNNNNGLGGGGYNSGGYNNNNNNSFNNNSGYNNNNGYNSNMNNNSNMGGNSIDQDVQMNPDYQDTSKNIQQIQASINILTKLVQQLGTQKDSMEVREKIRNCVESTTGLIHNSSNKVKNLSSLSKTTRDSRNKLLYDKLCREYNQCIQQFKEIATTASRKEKSTPIPTQDQFNNSNNRNNNNNNQAITKNSTFQGGWNDDQEDESQSLMEASRLQQLKQIESEREYQNSIIQERDEGIRKIEQSIVEINDIFLDLSNIVAEQGVMINTIEASLESTVMNTKEGVVHLQQASKHQRSSRTKMCWIALILLIVAAVLGLILFFTLRK